MSNPLVSIVIPTFNKATLALETLKSVAEQTYANWECIIVDDGSTKADYNTLQTFVEKNKKFSLYKRPDTSKKGANACRNYGMALSKGEYIQFFDSDDLMFPECIEGRVNALLNSEYDFVVFCMALIYGDKKVLDDDLYFVSNWEEALKEFLGPKKLPWNLQRTLFKANLIRNSILFNEDLQRFQDIEFNIRVLINTQPKFKMVQEFDCYYRFVSQDNKRTGQFNLNVFHSIPEFLRSVTLLISKETFKKNKTYFQERVYNYLSLYTIKSIPFSDFKKVLKSSRKHIEKKYITTTKFKAFYFKTLKKLYT